MLSSIAGAIVPRLPISGHRDRTNTSFEDRDSRSFERDQQRISDAYRRLNFSPMGTGVMSDSIWPLNRARLAELLGFDGIVENSMSNERRVTRSKRAQGEALNLLAVHHGESGDHR